MSLKGIKARALSVGFCRRPSNLALAPALFNGEREQESMRTVQLCLCTGQRHWENGTRA